MSDHHPENILLHPSEVTPAFRRAVVKVHRGEGDELTIEEIAALRLVATSIEREEDPRDR